MPAELATHKGVQDAETCGECRVTGGPALNPSERNTIDLAPV